MGYPPTYTPSHTPSQLHSELTPGLAHSQNHNSSYARRQASVSSGCVCVRLMIHGITVVVAWVCVCVGGGDSSNGEWKWTAVLERATVPAFPPSHTNELIC